MVTGIFYAHSGWRYLVLLVLVVILAKVLIGMFGKSRWGSFDALLNRITPIVIDIQFLLGLVLWVLQQRWTGSSSLASWEHPVTMIIAVALAHVTPSRVKKAPTDAAKFQAATVGYVITTLVVALGVARITGVM